MTTNVDVYFIDGCGRCALGGTPDCKVNRWREELALLRELILACGLTEEAKWGVPCYTYQQKNVLMLAAFKAHCFLSFFKGALLQDEKGILEKGGENTQAGRLLRFTHYQEIMTKADVIKAYIFEAVEVEKAGLKVEYKDVSEYAIPEEFQQAMAEDAELQAAFESLSPGRKKGYLIYFSAAKQSQTRSARIERCREKILMGKDINEK